MSKEPRWDWKASEIMTRPVETVRARDSVRSAAQLFTERSISAAAVINENGRPVGVITKTDIVRYREQESGLHSIAKRKPRSDWKDDGDPHGFQISNVDDLIENWMTPVIFSVPADTPMSAVATRMIKYGTHHIFIRGRTQEDIIGIVSSFDILRRVAKSANGTGAGHKCEGRCHPDGEEEIL